MAKLTDIQIKRYNSTSRKGHYAYMKGSAGVRVWKLREGVPLDAYIKGYESGLTVYQARKKHGYLWQTPEKATGQRKRYMTTLGKKGRLSDAFGHGAVKHTTTLDRLATPGGEVAAYDALFKRLVLDTKLLNVVKKNISDLRGSLAYTIRLNGRRGPIGEFHDIGRWTIKDVVAGYRGKLKYRKGTVIPGMDDWDQYAENQPLKLDARQIRLNENNVTQWRGGTISDVKVTILFRR